MDPAQLADEDEVLAQDLEALKTEFTRLPASDVRPDLGFLYSMLDAFDEDEAQTLAQRAVGLHEGVCRELYAQEQAWGACYRLGSVFPPRHGRGP